MCQETFYQMHLNGKTVGMFVSPPLYTKKLAKVIEHAKLNWIMLALLNFE